MSVEWLDHPVDKDYSAAARFLSLMWGPAVTSDAVLSLQQAPVTQRRANDILRAAGLEARPKSDPSVRKDFDRIKAGTQLSPVLLVADGNRCVIADGYHRVSAVYHYDEDADIRCVLTYLPQ
jgi:hypothetical protein